MRKIFSCIISDHEYFLIIVCVNHVKQVHIIIDELARALDDIEDTIQIDNNVSKSSNSLNGSKQRNWITFT